MDLLTHPPRFDKPLKGGTIGESERFEAGVEPGQVDGCGTNWGPHRQRIGICRNHHIVENPCGMVVPGRGLGGILGAAVDAQAPPPLLLGRFFDY